MNKKNVLITLTILFISFFVSTSYAQQDSQFTQYMYNTETINPAYTGTRGQLSFTSLFSTQWVGIEGAPKTATFTVSSPLGERLGLGLGIVQDNIGPSKESTVVVDFSYTILINEDVKLALGVDGGVNLLNIDYSLLNIFPDNVFQFNINNRLTPIIGAGAYLFNDTWYAGISIPNFLETKHYDDNSISNATEKSNLYIIGGYVFNLSEFVKFKPAILGKFTANAPVAVDFSANFLFFEKFTLGAAYRLDAAFSALVAFQISNQLLLGYGYDYDTSNLGNYNSGSHEFILRFDVLNNSRDKIVSPRFF